MLLKTNFKKLKKYYFNIFLDKKNILKNNDAKMRFTCAWKNYYRDGIKSLVVKYLSIYTHFSLEKEEELKPNKDSQNQLAAMD